MNTPAWQHLARSLESAGDIQRATEVLEAAASEGHLEALVRLAMMTWLKEDSRSDELIRHVESEVTEEDWETHWSLHQAYTLGIQAGYKYQARDARAFHHLILAAKWSGHPRMKFTVGVTYWHGHNGVEQDFSAAEHWIGEAAESGVPDIVKSYKKLMQRRGRARDA